MINWGGFSMKQSRKVRKAVKMAMARVAAGQAKEVNFLKDRIKTISSERDTALLTAESVQNKMADITNRLASQTEILKLVEAEKKELSESLADIGEKLNEALADKEKTHKSNKAFAKDYERLIEDKKDLEHEVLALERKLASSDKCVNEKEKCIEELRRKVEYLQLPWWRKLFSIERFSD